MKRTLRRVVWIAAVILLIPGVAAASWLATGTGDAASTADLLGTGATPTATVNGRNVTVSWTATTFLDGTGADAYVVSRYTAGGAPQSIGASCDGTIAALTCTEAAVPTGTWRYSVTPVHGTDWTGVEGAPSTSVSVAAPAFSFDSAATVDSLPTTRTGTLASFATGESVTFRLDSPTGTLLTGSHSVIGPAGTATTSTTLPAGTTQGTHDIHAVGSLGSQASASITVDTIAPTVSAAVIQKSAGGDVGYLAQAGTYYLYANVTDAVSGVAGVTADVSAITAGASASSLSAGSWTVGGVTYGYRSALLTADGTLAAGSKAFSIGATDVAGNVGSTGGWSVTVDNTAPASSNVQITNGGTTVGKPEAGDVLTLTYSDTMDAQSILAGWDGGATSVTVRITSAGGSDRLTVHDTGGTQLPLGTVRLNDTVYVATGAVDFTGSTMTRSGAVIQIVLGTPSGATGTSTSTPTMRWTTATGATDRAGNACTAGNLNEPGVADNDF